jgi:hypothetical protein
MSLKTGLPQLIQDLYEISKDVAEGKPASIMAKREAEAIKKFLRSGVPKTLITFPGTVTGPSVGSGVGGIDTTAPGSGLAAGADEAKADVSASWDHKDEPSNSLEFAKKRAQSVYDYFSKAKVQTIDNTAGPSGPVTGIGGLFSSSPGPGLDSGVDKFVADLTSVYSKVQELRPIGPCATEYMAAMESFCKLIKVETVGTMTGGSTAESVSGTIS